MVLFPFYYYSHLLTYTNFAILMDTMRQTLFSCLYILKWFVLFILSYQAISLTWRIVWESALPKLSSSRLILLRSIVLIPISSLKNVTKSEPESTKTISLLENRASSSYSSILFVTKQSRTNFNAGR